MNPCGVLLINVGTPENPSPQAVGKYLREFLMDPFVIDINPVLRWLLVNIAIVPRRSKDSAELYQKVWGESGSPLLVYSNQLAELVQKELGKDFLVEVAMRYGNPSIESAVKRFSEQGVKRVLIFPLYPQYSLAATESSLLKATHLIQKYIPSAEIRAVPAFYGKEEYLSALTEVTRRELKKISYDQVLFSFHGLPERQVKKTDSTGKHCVCDAACCEVMVEANKDCYRAQCFATARSLAMRLEIPAEKYRVSFQSRLKGAPWIRPFSDEYYRTLPKLGVERLAVVCPSFVADCLETLEEVQIRGQKEFRENGGKELTLIPSLNAEPSWAKSVAKLITNYQPKT